VHELHPLPVTGRLSPPLPLLTAANRESARLVFVPWQFTQAMGASA